VIRETARRDLAHRLILAWIVVVALLLTSVGRVAAVTARSAAIGKPATEAITSLSQSREGQAPTWVIAFSAAKPLHRVSNQASVTELFLSNTTCPSTAAIRTESVARVSPSNAAYISCSEEGNTAELQFRSALNDRILLAPGATSLTISILAAPSMAQRRPHIIPKGTTLGRNFFNVEGLQRASEMEQSAERDNLQLLIKTNRGTTIANNATTRLASLPKPFRPIFLNSGPFAGEANGRVVSGTRVEFLGHGGDEQTALELTRVYYFVYDSRTGSLLLAGDQLAPDDLAVRYGLTPNRLAGVK